MPYLTRLSRTQYLWLIGTSIAAAGIVALGWALEPQHKRGFHRLIHHGDEHSGDRAEAGRHGQGPGARIRSAGGRIESKTAS